MKSYKLDILLATEQMEYCAKERAYIGYDPDTHQDFGVVDSKTFNSKEDALSYIKQTYNFNNPIIENGCIEDVWDGEHDYREPLENRIPFCEKFTFILSEVETKQIKFVDKDLVE